MQRPLGERPGVLETVFELSPDHLVCGSHVEEHRLPQAFCEAPHFSVRGARRVNIAGREQVEGAAELRQRLDLWVSGLPREREKLVGEGDALVEVSDVETRGLTAFERDYQR